MYGRMAGLDLISYNIKPGPKTDDIQVTRADYPNN
jgi:hypothetical protein